MFRFSSSAAVSSAKQVCICRCLFYCSQAGATRHGDQVHLKRSKPPLTPFTVGLFAKRTKELILFLASSHRPRLHTRFTARRCAYCSFLKTRATRLLKISYVFLLFFKEKNRPEKTIKNPSVYLFHLKNKKDGVIFYFT